MRLQVQRYVISETEGQKGRDEQGEGKGEGEGN